MAKLSSKKIYHKSREKNGGHQARISENFNKKIKEIRKEILLNTDIDRISTEEITNLITRHKAWPEIVKDIGKVTEEEIKKYGNHYE